MRSTRLTLAAVLVASVSTGSVLADMPASLKAEIDSNPSQPREAIVLFRAADTAPANVASARRGERSALKAQLMSQAERTQESVKAQLSGWTLNPRIGNFTRSIKKVQTLWTINAMTLIADGKTLSELAARSDVKAVLPSRVRKLLPTKVTGDAIPKGDYTYGLKKIGADRIHAELNAFGEGVTVGILDTGIDANHPDLKDKVVAWKSFVDTGDTPNDGHGHGTHCAGTIAGGNTSGTQIGVAPKAKLVIGQIFSASGSTTDAAILAAMNWVADPDGNATTDDAPSVVSNSWGGGQGSMETEKPYWDLIARWIQLGIFPSFAAGNEGPGASSMSTPGGFPHNFAVGATDDQDRIASFSSRGPIVWEGQSYTKPEISAPGVDVLSAKPGGGYQKMSGTSMATPHMSGVVALLYAANPDFTVAQVAQLLKETAQDLGAPGHDNNFGAGRVAAHQVVSVALKGGKLAATLTDAQGNRIPGKIRIEGGASSIVNDTGSLNLVLMEGTYTLVASSFGFFESNAVQVTIVKGQTTDKTISLTKAPQGGVKVIVTDADTFEFVPAKVKVLDTPLPEATTGADGSAGVTAPQGQYNMLVKAFGYEPQILEGVTVDSGCGVVEARLKHLPDILVFDHDAGKPYESYYKNALDALNKKYNYVDSANVTEGDEETLLAYPVMVYFTGDDYQGTVPDATQASLKKYLASGGKLIISGQDIGYDLKSSPFYKDVLHAKHLKDATETRAVSGEGLSFNIQGGDGANNQKYPDQIAIEGDSGVTKLFDYGGNEGPAGLHITVGQGQVVYLPFGFEGIDTAANRTAVMKTILGKVGVTLQSKFARLDPITRTFGAEAGRLYKNYLVDCFEKATPAEQDTVRGLVRGLTPRR